MTAPSTPPPASSTSTSTSTSEPGPITYAAAGVDVEAGDKAVELMKESIRRATRPEVLGGLGGSAGGAGGLMALAGQLQAKGLDMNQMKRVGQEIFHYGEEQIGPDKAREIFKNIPGLSAML